MIGSRGSAFPRRALLRVSARLVTATLAGSCRVLFDRFVGDLERLGDWLVAEGVTHVALEATGVFWKRVWFVLEETDVELFLVNSRNMRMVPGRKTDVADAGWIAQLLEAGLVPGSYVPLPVMRELRDLTCYRKRLIQDHTREGQRVEKVL